MRARLLQGRNPSCLWCETPTSSWKSEARRDCHLHRLISKLVHSSVAGLRIHKVEGVSNGRRDSRGNTATAERMEKALARSAVGDHAAFGDIVREYQAMVFSMAYYFLHDRSLAEETAQDVFLRLYQNLGRIKSPAHLMLWLRQVAGPEFQPFVRVRSRRDGEQTFVYGRELGRDFELLVVTLEQDEACVVKMRINPEQVHNWFDDPPAMTRKTSASDGAAR